MNALKHMEAIFVALAAVALSVSFFTTHTKPLDVAADSAIVAKHLTAAETTALI